uniref:Uncharacterized protein n=1 Tax=Haptolina ericina TaxID=156174 RepID=A0A7S3EVV6_9EUKA
MSKVQARAHRFVSHSWSAPTNWTQLMGKNCSYCDLKATELHVVAMDVAATLGCTWQEVTFWVDKCCIPQQHRLTAICINLLEDFIQRSDGMVVLLSWQYFERLWCIYEWAAFLLHHDARRILICADAFIRPGTQQMFIDAVRHFTVRSAKCHDEADRAVLDAKIAEYYLSEEAFEALTRSTAIALLAASAARRCARHEHNRWGEFTPWVELARECGFDELADALTTADPVRWRREAYVAVASRSELAPPNARGRVGSCRDWSCTFEESVDAWFEAAVNPLLHTIKQASVRRNSRFRRLAMKTHNLTGFCSRISARLSSRSTEGSLCRGPCHTTGGRSTEGRSTGGRGATESESTEESPTSAGSRNRPREGGDDPEPGIRASNLQKDPIAEERSARDALSATFIAEWSRGLQPLCRPLFVSWAHEGSPAAGERLFCSWAEPSWASHNLD